MAQHWVWVVAFVGAACGGKPAPEPGSPSAGAPGWHPGGGPPASAQTGSSPLRAYEDAMRARLAPCADDTGSRWPSRACRRALRELVDGCGTADLHALMTTDRVTEPCEQALYRLLPAEDSHRSRVFVLGAVRAGTGVDLYVTASDADGEPAPALLADVRIELDGDVVATPTATPLPARCVAPIFTASSILDYSASMSDRDVDASIALFRALYDAVPAGCLETDVRVFSTDVRLRGRVTADRAAMQRAIARDEAMPRATTALVDAIGDGAHAVRSRAAPVRLLLVATDGMENASQRWSYADAVATARAGGVRVLTFGSLLSDVRFLEHVGAQTGGLFLFRAHAKLLADAAGSVGRLLAATRRIHVADARLAAATHVTVTTGAHRVDVALR